MDHLGTYRGYNIAITLHSNGNRKFPKWHSSIQMDLIGHVATEPCFTTDPLDSTVSEARDRAIRVARRIIDERPGAAAISDNDLAGD